MRKTIVVLAMLALVVPALADTLESAQFGGNMYVDYSTGITSTSQAQRATPVMVYDNMTSAAVGGRSSTDKYAMWGDDVLMTGTGILRYFGFTIYNPSTSGSALTNPEVDLSFFDTPDGNYIGGFSGTITGTLNAGYFWNITFEDLDLDFTLDLAPNTELYVMQQMTSYIGTPAKLGVIFKNPPVIGSSPGDDFYVGAIGDPVYPTAGWYTAGVGATSNNVGFAIGLTPEPASLALLAIGAVALLRRR
jgi:hypothetical protein